MKGSLELFQYRRPIESNHTPSAISIGPNSLAIAINPLLGLAKSTPEYELFVQHLPSIKTYVWHGH